MLPVVGVGSRHVVALQERADVVDFEERDRSLRLPVGVEDLPDVSIAPGPVCVAPAVLAVIGDDHELEHMVVQRQRHLVERLHVLVERRDRQDIRHIPEIRSQAEVRRVVAHRCREPDGLGTVRTRPRIADQPLAGPESLKNVRPTTVERLLIRGEMGLPLTASLDLQPVGVRPLRNDPQG